MPKNKFAKLVHRVGLIIKKSPSIILFFINFTQRPY